MLKTIQQAASFSPAKKPFSGNSDCYNFGRRGTPLADREARRQRWRNFKHSVKIGAAALAITVAGLVMPSSSSIAQGTVKKTDTSHVQATLKIPVTSIKDGHIIVDSDGNYLDASEALKAMAGKGNASDKDVKAVLDNATPMQVKSDDNTTTEAAYTRCYVFNKGVIVLYFDQLGDWIGNGAFPTDGTYLNAGMVTGDGKLMVMAFSKQLVCLSESGFTTIGFFTEAKWGKLDTVLFHSSVDKAAFIDSVRLFKQKNGDAAGIDTAKFCANAFLKWKTLEKEGGKAQIGAYTIENVGGELKAYNDSMIRFLSDGDVAVISSSGKYAQTFRWKK
ncbi:Uncharacterised protein [uncultured archaeon]|nr:Uncharacterised protein [uncultured archaeon]